MRDPEVERLQFFLQQVGFFPAGETTTFFGRITLRAVVAYQKAKGIEPAVGFVGPLTRAAMAGGQPAPSAAATFTRSLYLGVRGDDVTLLQQKLQALGFFPAAQAPTGFFGNLTVEAVRQFQCAKGIVCEGDFASTGYGVAGPKTLQRIGN